MSTERVSTDHATKRKKKVERQQQHVFYISNLSNSWTKINEEYWNPFVALEVTDIVSEDSSSPKMKQRSKDFQKHFATLYRTKKIADFTVLIGFIRCDYCSKTSTNYRSNTDSHSIFFLLLYSHINFAFCIELAIYRINFNLNLINFCCCYSHTEQL